MACYHGHRSCLAQPSCSDPTPHPHPHRPHPHAPTPPTPTPTQSNLPNQNHMLLPDCSTLAQVINKNTYQVLNPRALKC